ncbi:hypothetical protein BCR42DRAFT_427709 [Absidia repens]|uniref:BHLH domain-containing protein n=1 Tax=Absidia repens TaxID=90262 RepID=A0A1X2HZ32_9FUNG|nr:hypothetical protein BCR42DRAFT_427709 [Absidia repens]
MAATNNNFDEQWSIPPTATSPSISPDSSSTSPSKSAISHAQKRTLQHDEQDNATTQVKERKSRKAPHELLTDAEKKANHIASEQKRRQNIRLGFDQLIEIVPALNSGNRSEALILQKSVDHIKQLITVKNDLKDQIRDLQALLGESPYDEDSSEDDLTYSAY